LTNNKIKNEICFVGTTTAKALELKKIKNIVIAEIHNRRCNCGSYKYYNTEESIEPSAKI
jgi:uroporphyrinogen-III synthase